MRSPVVLALVSLALVACRTTSGYVEQIEVSSDLRPPDGQALIVFLRPDAFAASARAAAIVDVTRDAELIAILHNATKTVQTVDPGEHYFMNVLAGTRTIMKADVVADRVYYAKVFVSQVHPLDPATQTEMIREYWEGTQAVRLSPLSSDWWEAHQQSVLGHRAKGFTAFEAYDDRERARFHMRPEQGVASPIGSN